jgi:hypothetical protein
MVMTKEQYDALTKEYQNQGKKLPTAKDIQFMLETFTPYGDVQTAKDASKAFQEGRYLDAAGNAALIAAGYTPLGPLARPAGRLAKRVARDKDMIIPALTDKDYAGMVTRETLLGKDPLAGKSVGAMSIDDLVAKRAEIMKQATEDYGERMGATIHSTNYAGPLDVNNFRYKRPNIPGKSNEFGIFTHSPMDPTDYGKRKFAVLYKDKPGNYVAGKQDTESDFSEIFIPERAVEDIFEID